MIDIEALRKLEQAATPRPWAWLPQFDLIQSTDVRQTVIISEPLTPADGALVVAAVNALPELLALLEEARDVVADMILDDASCVCCTEARAFLAKLSKEAAGT